MTGKEFEFFLNENTNGNKELEYGSTTVTLTPEEAKNFLKKHYLKNRVLSSGNVRKYTSMMELNMFDRNIGQTIILDKKGHILDAHHRLEALSNVRSDEYSYSFIVIYGAVSSPYIDTGKHRSAVDNVAMLENTVQEDMNILNGVCGKALKFFANVNEKSNIGKTVYLAKTVAILRDVCENFEFFATSIADEKHMPSDGCVAAIFDQFLKGNLDSNDVTAIFGVLSKYNYAITLEKRKNASFTKVTEANNEARNAEIEMFNTEHIWSSLASTIKSLGGGGTKQKECFYLTTMAIEHCKKGRDVEIRSSSTSTYNRNVLSSVKDMFNLFLFENEYEFKEENMGGMSRCYVQRVA